MVGVAGGIPNKGFWNKLELFMVFGAGVVDVVVADAVVDAADVVVVVD